MAGTIGFELFTLRRGQSDKNEMNLNLLISIYFIFFHFIVVQFF